MLCDSTMRAVDDDVSAPFHCNRSRPSRSAADRLNTRCDLPKPARGRVPLNIHRPVRLLYAAVKYGQTASRVKCG